MNHEGPNVTQFFWLLLIAFGVALLARRLRVPYALALVVTGLAIGAPRLLPHARLEPALLFTVFLPPLLFESALHLRLDALRRDWKPIAIYTLFGTVLSTFIVGGLMSWLLSLPLSVALVFGALISATDPISVIAIFKRLGAGRRLTLIMEAESLFNDGVAVVLFTVLLGAALSPHGGPASLLSSTVDGLGQFARLVLGGALLGAAIGALASRVHRDLDDHLVEITLTTVVAFGAYLGAEALHVSGVVAVVAAGLAIGNFGQTAMSPSTRLAVTAFWEYAGFVVNSIVFLLVGIEVAYFNWTDKLGVALAAAIVVLAGRAVIYPLSFVVNRVGGEVPGPWRHILFWGGLRGALSMALVLGLPAKFPQRDTLVAATFGVVLFSLLVQGLSIGSLLKRLGLSGTSVRSSRGNQRLASEIAAAKAALAHLDQMRLRETYAPWIIETLAHDYERRLAELEPGGESASALDGMTEEKQSAEVRSLLLEVEKSSYQDAEKQGLLAEDDWKRVSARIDAEMLALKLKLTAP